MKKIITCTLFLLALCLCFSGCGAGTAPADVELSAVMQQIRESVELPEMIDLTADDLADYFGIEAQEVTDFAVCINANGFEKEEVVLLRAVDAQTVAVLAEKLESSRQNAAAEMQNYLPEQYALIAQSSVRTDGLYVSLCISQNAQQIADILDSCFA